MSTPSGYVEKVLNETEQSEGYVTAIGLGLRTKC